MRRRRFLVLIGILILQPASGESLKIAQFRQTLARYVASHKSDQAIAIKVESMQLSERLTPEVRRRIEAELKLGPKTSLALEMQSDLSVFLDPPVDELPTQSPPAPGIRDQIFQKAVAFAAGTMRHMPDFLATRVTRRFDNRPTVVSVSGWFPAQTELQYEGTATEKITYRGGEEVPDTQTDPGGSKPNGQHSVTDLTTTGEFGPALVVALNDAIDGRLDWSRWEIIDGKLSAVYRFEVPEDVSHYWVNFCWLLRPLGSVSRRMSSLDVATTNCYRGKPGYHGTLAIHPDSGAIMRITLESELPRSIPLGRAAISIEYGTVEIGGQPYVCPQLGIAISVVNYQPTSTVPGRSICASMKRHLRTITASDRSPGSFRTRQTTSIMLLNFPNLSGAELCILLREAAGKTLSGNTAI